MTKQVLIEQRSCCVSALIQNQRIYWQVEAYLVTRWFWIARFTVLYSIFVIEVGKEMG